MPRAAARRHWRGAAAALLEQHVGGGAILARRKGADELGDRVRHRAGTRLAQGKQTWRGPGP